MITQRFFLSLGGMILSLLFSYVVLSAHAEAATVLSVCTEGCSFTTIQSAIDAIPAQLSDAYVVEIRDSRRYSESLTIGGKGTNASRTITLRAADGATPTVLSSAYASALNLHYQSYVVIERLQFTGDLRAHAGGISMNGGGNNVIRNNRFSSFNRGTMVVVYGSNANTIEGNIFATSVATTGVSVYYYNSDNVIRNNTFTNVQRAVVLGNRVRSNTIVDNTFLLDGGSDTALVAQDIDLSRMQLSRITNNKYYLARGATLGTVQGTSYDTLNTWQTATGFDRDSTLLSVPTAPSFTPWSEVTKTVCASGCDYATIAAAVDAIPSDVPGITHELITRNISYRIAVQDAGPYTGGIRIGAVTDADHTITIAGAPGIYPRILEEKYKNALYIYYTDYITIRGFSFPGGHQTNFFGGPILIEGSHNTIEDNRIGGDRYTDAPAIVIHGGEDNRILSNEIRNVSRGIFIYFWSGKHLIYGNTIADSFNAVGMNNRTYDIRIEQNTFFHNRRGIDIGADRVSCFNEEDKPISCNYTVRNNIIVTDGDTHAAFVFAKPESQASFVSDYNLFTATNNAVIGTVGSTTYTTVSSWQAQGDDVHSLFDDPFFVDATAPPYDFHLQSKGGRFLHGNFVIDLAHSPAIDAGDPVSIFSNESSPNGSRVNIGAHGNTVEASRSILAVSPPQPPPASAPNDAAWIDTTDTDWDTAQKLSVTVAGIGSAASLTLGAHNEAWETVAIGIRETIADIAFVSAHDGFAVGSNGTILKWNGSTWSSVASGTTENLWSVSFVNATTAWAVGTNGTILKWNGSTWSSVASGTTEHLLNIAFVNATTAWAVGTNGTILKWNGSTWSSVASGVPKTLNAISMNSASDGWIVGNTGTILKWNGSTWTNTASPTTQTLLGVEGRPDGSTIVIGDAGFIARYTNGAWTPHTILTSGALLSMAFLPSGRGWIVGEAGTILETQNGSTWTLASGPQSTEAFFTTAFAGTTQWVAGTNGAAFTIARTSSTEGSIISRVFDAGVVPQWKAISWSGSTPNGATVRLQFATSVSADGPWSFVGPDGTNASFYIGAENTLIAAHAGQRFARYQLFLTRTGEAPSVADVRAHYQYDATLPPLAPTILLPRNGMPVNGGTLTWTGIPNVTGYAITVARDTAFIDPVFTGSTTALFLAMPSLDDGVYAWRVRANNVSGTSPWSETQTFTLDRTAPGAPQLTLPLHAMAVAATPAFAWTPAADALYYQLQISTLSDFSSPLIDTTLLSLTDFVPAFPFTNGQYYWRVRARDRVGNPSAWTQAQFLLAATEAPPSIAPPLLAPANTMVTNGQILTFRWESVPEARAYLLEVSGGASFTDTVFAPTTVGGTEFVWDSTVPDGQYYWRVRAMNSGGNGPWSSEQTFTIDKTPSPLAVILEPSIDSLVTTPATPRFTWEPVPEAVSYILEVEDRRQEGIIEPSFQFKEPFDTGTHVWRIQSVDAAGNTSEGATSSFSVVQKGRYPPEPPPTAREEQVLPKETIVTHKEKVEKKEEIITRTTPKENKENQEQKIITQEPPSGATTEQQPFIPQTPSSPTYVTPATPETTIPQAPEVSAPVAETVPSNTPIAGSSFFGRSVDVLTTTVDTIVTATSDVGRQVAKETVAVTAVVAAGTEKVVRTTAPVAVPTLTTLAPIAIAVNPITAASLPVIPNMMGQAFSWLFSALGVKRKRKNPWGMVYDAITKEPVGLAILRLFDAGTKQLLATQVTDNQGRFEFLVKPGVYTLAVVKPSYTFPSTIIAGKSDEEILDVYHGETITITSEQQNIHVNIPLDGEDPTKREGVKSVAIWFGHVRRLFAKASLPLLVAGTAVSVVFYAFSQTRYNLLMLLAYVVLAAYHTVLIPKNAKAWGTIFDAVTLQPVPLALVHIIDPQFQRVLKSRLSDYHGRFTFLPEPGTYTLRVAKPGYAFPSAQPMMTRKYRHLYHGGTITVEKKRSIIAADVPLDPVVLHTPQAETSSPVPPQVPTQALSTPASGGLS